MKYIRIEVNDGFEKGQCLECPLSSINCGFYEEIVCPLGCRYDKCPLEVISN